MAKKRVILHTGFHKTGSSALQAFLAENVNALAAAGVDYPYPESASIVDAGGCSGNIVQILYREGFMKGYRRERDILPWSRVTPEFADRVVEIVNSSEQEAVILSSEMLGNVDSEVLSRLVGGLPQLEIVCFVRDPFDFVSSCWRQLVKDSVYKPSLLEYLDRGYSSKRGISMLQAFPRFKALGVPITAIRYERHRPNVARAFMEAARLSDTFPGSIDSGRSVNQSLSGSEALMVTILAKQLPRDFVATFVRSAMARPRHEDGSPFYDHVIHQVILDRFSESIALINEYLPAADQISATLREQPDVPIRIDADDVELHLELLRRYPLPSRTVRLKAAFYPLWNRARQVLGLKPTLPPDFDETAYLFHNPDVAAAKADPAEHYLLHGRGEDRRYRFH